MTKLSTIVFNQQAILGEQFQHLGSPRGAFWNRKKVFLSYEKKKGFTLVTLNFFQLFLRKLGFYGSTRLAHVCLAIDKFKLRKFALKPEKRKAWDAFENRIKQLWSKTYPNASMPSFASSYTVILGNVSNLEDAEVICFADMHIDPHFSKVIGEIVNRYHQPEDEIAVEGVQAGTKLVDHSRHNFLKHVHPDFFVQGWEPPGHKARRPKSFVEAAAKSKELLKEYEQFAKSVPKEKKFTPEQFQELEKKAEQLLKKLTPYFDYFYYPNNKKLAHQGAKKLKNAEVFLKKILSEIKKGTFNSDYTVILKVLYDIINQLVKRERRARYAHWDPKEYERLKKIDTCRNASLSETIDRLSTSKRRLFVVAGALHLLKHRVFRSTELLDNVTGALWRHKFAIVVPNSVLKDFFLKELNAELSKIPYPLKACN